MQANVADVKQKSVKKSQSANLGVLNSNGDKSDFLQISFKINTDTNVLALLELTFTTNKK